jgi:pyruvate,water dikinase
MADLTFEKPGPGTWELDEAHFSKPFSRWMQDVFPPAMAKGFGQSMAHYGMLLDEPEVEPVNGFMYLSMRPVVGPTEADSPPPKLLFALMKLIHPRLRRRFKRIEETFETKRWRADLEQWDSEWMLERVEENRSLQALDPA